MRSLRKKYQDHKGNAKKKGIAFSLTYNEWLWIWSESGHLEERGRHVGQYVMARFGDKGPYEIGNVKIIPHIENIKERVFSSEEIARRSTVRIGGAHLGPKRHTEETKLAIGQARRLAWARKKQHLLDAADCG